MSRTKITSFRVDPELSAWLVRYIPAGQESGYPGTSSQLRDDLLMLQGLISVGVKRLEGRFTLAEASAICDGLNGFYPTWPALVEFLPRGLVTQLTQETNEVDLGAKWGVDMHQLGKKLTRLTPLEAVALVHLARLFWKDDARGGVARFFRLAPDGGARKARRK